MRRVRGSSSFIVIPVSKLNLKKGANQPTVSWILKEMRVALITAERAALTWCSVSGFGGYSSIHQWHGLFSYGYQINHLLLDPAKQDRNFLKASPSSSALSPVNAAIIGSISRWHPICPQVVDSGRVDYVNVHYANNVTLEESVAGHLDQCLKLLESRSKVSWVRLSTTSSGLFQNFRKYV